MPHRRLHVGMRNDYEIRGDHVAIFVPARGSGMMETLVDLADFELVRAVPTRWRANKTKKKGCICSWYVIAEVWRKNKRSYAYMHRLIMGEPSGLVVDHENGDGLLNRRSNLRVVTVATNNKNRINRQSTNTSGFRGVTYNHAMKKFQAQAKFDGVNHILGYFVEPTEAADVVKNFWEERGFQYGNYDTRSTNSGSHNSGD